MAKYGMKYADNGTRTKGKDDKGDEDVSVDDLPVFSDQRPTTTASEALPLFDGMGYTTAVDNTAAPVFIMPDTGVGDPIPPPPTEDPDPDPEPEPRPRLERIDPRGPQLIQTPKGELIQPSGEGFVTREQNVTMYPNPQRGPHGTVFGKSISDTIRMKNPVTGEITEDVVGLDEEEQAYRNFILAGRQRGTARRGPRGGYTYEAMQYPDYDTALLEQYSPELYAQYNKEVTGGARVPGSALPYLQQVEGFEGFEGSGAYHMDDREYGGNAPRVSSAGNQLQVSDDYYEKAKAYEDRRLAADETGKSRRQDFLNRRERANLDRRLAEQNMNYGGKFKVLKKKRR